MSNEYLSSDFSYKKYSLDHLEEWVNDALNCEDITPQEIYKTITDAIDNNIEYHKKYLTKNIEVLSLLKGYEPSVDFDTSSKDWEDFWASDQYTEEELNAMCDAAEEKEKCREYNLREAEYYNKRAQLDLEEVNKQLAIAREHDDKEMTKKGFVRDENGSWSKQTDKGVATVSEKPDPVIEEIKKEGGYEWTPGV